VRTAWQLDPSIAIHLADRIGRPSIQAEVGRLVRSNTREVLDSPEASRFLLQADRMDSKNKRDLKVAPYIEFLLDPLLI
jgi:phosphatidylinositol 4-kinase A